MTRNLLPLLLAAALAASVAPVAEAQSASCTVSTWSWQLFLRCSGPATLDLYAEWCPEHPAVDCLMDHVLTCTAQTRSPVLLCPLS